MTVLCNWFHSGVLCWSIYSNIESINGIKYNEIFMVQEMRNNHTGQTGSFEASTLPVKFKHSLEQTVEITASRPPLLTCVVAELVWLSGYLKKRNGFLWHLMDSSALSHLAVIIFQP